MSAVTTNVASKRSQSSPVKTMPLWQRLLNWVAKKDETYRQTIKLRSQPDDRLKDMALTRQQANQGFYQRFGKKAADQPPIVLQGW